MDLSELARALRDTAQSASNAVASNVSGPVDLIAAALRKAGVPVPQDAVGGSEWMARKGLTREVPMGAPRLVGETLGLAGPIAVQAKAPQIAAAANKMVDNAMAPRVMNPQAGAIVWHGSPHRFTKFDSSKIGTGEGAQAYGHGLYLAESPDVAKSYSPRDPGYEEKLLKMYKAAERGRKYDAMDVLESAMMHQTPSELREQFGRAAEPVIKQIESIPINVGGFYKVDLPDEQIARMLDWDKPLGQQKQVASGIQKAFVGGDSPLSPSEQFTIRDWLNDYVRLQNMTPTRLPGVDLQSGRVVERLRQQGIPGIRYLDQGSRGAGQGTSNFVVFPGNEDMLKILEINGQPVQAVIDALRNNR